MIHARLNNEKIFKIRKSKEGETTRTKEGKKQKEVSVRIFASVSGAHEDYEPMILAIPFTL